jgi:hypothetical protein
MCKCIEHVLHVIRQVVAGELDARQRVCVQAAGRERGGDARGFVTVPCVVEALEDDGRLLGQRTRSPARR